MEELAPWEEEYTNPVSEDTGVGSSPWEEEFEIQPEQTEVAELPVPSTNMFASMDDAHAKATFDAYAKHPLTTTDEQGNLFYKGVPVPQPEGNSWFVNMLTGGGEDPGLERIEQADDSIVGNIVEGTRDFLGGVAGGALINAPKNIVKGAHAIGQYMPHNLLLNQIPGVQGVRDWEAEQIDEYMPEYNPEGTAQGIGAVTGEVAAGVVIGNKATAALKAAGAGREVLNALADKLPKFTHYMARIGANSIASAAGTAATVEGTNDTLLVGPDAAYPALQGLDGKSESEVQEILEKRLNVFLDGIIIAAPVEVAADIGKGAFTFAKESFFRPIIAQFKEGTKEKLTMESILRQIGQMTGDESPEALEAIKQMIADSLSTEDGRKIVAQIGIPGVKDVDVALDTVTAIERGITDPSEKAANVKEALRRIRQENVQAGGLQTSTAMDRPGVALQDLLAQTDEAFGGSDAMQKSTTGIRRMGSNIVGEEGMKMDEATRNLEAARKSEQVFLDDPSIGSKLAEAKGKPLGETYQVRNTIADEIIQTIDEGLADIGKTNKELWERLPEGLPTDLESLDPLITDASEFLSKPLKNSLEEAKGDFKALQKLRGNLGKAIDQAEKRGFGIDEIRALRDNISKQQPLWLKSQLEDPEAVKGLSKLLSIPQKGMQSRLEKGVSTLKEAEDYYTGVKSEVESGAVKEIKDIGREYKFDAPTRGDEVEKVLKDTMTSDFYRKADHLAKTLARPEFKGKQNLLSDYAKADIVDQLRVKILSGEGLTDLNLDDVYRQIQKYRQTFNANALEGLSKELDSFEASLRKNQGNIKALEEISKNATKEFETIKDRVFGEILSDFFEKSGVSKGDGYAVFKSMFRDDSSIDRLRGLIADAQRTGNESVLDGMKAAYSRYLDEFIFTPDSTPSGGRKISLPKAQDFSRKSVALIDMGEEIFGADSPFMTAVQQLVDPSLSIARSRRLGAAPSVDTGFSYKKAKDAQNKLVNIFIGPLTRTGAKIGATFGSALQWLDPNAAAIAIKNRIFDDPDEFLRILNNVEVSGLKDSRNLRDAFLFLVKAGVVQQSDYDAWLKDAESLILEDETEEALPQ